MTNPNNRRDFIIKVASVTGALAGGSFLSACGGVDEPVLEFNYGVASGDPLTSRVILWTHAKYKDLNTPVQLIYQVSTNASFTDVVSSETVTANESTGFTAKVDAGGLSAGQEYFYRFVRGRWSSPVGKTRTLPASNVTSVKLAVFSCALYSEGYFNAYNDAGKSDAQYAVHLGDYIYEFGSDPTQFGNADAVNLNRVTQPDKDIVSLSDYRIRYALYRTDPDLKALHAKMPWITVWDDHEFADNARVDGANNHNETKQGAWSARKNAASQAYHEWMPIRTPDPANLLKIYRRFDFGSVFTLHMLDTRIEGRARQYDSYGDTDGGLTRYATALATRSDATHYMMSPAQQTWLTDGTAASTATWQILGNQDIMARMWFPATVLQANAAATANPSTATQAAVFQSITDFLTAKATPANLRTPTQIGLVDTSTNPRLPYDLDPWDGYPLQREALLRTIQAQAKKLVVLTGDSHNAWFANVTTLDGTKVGVEFAGASVTSPGFESVGLGGVASSIDGTAVVPNTFGTGMGLVDSVNFAETQRRGYLLITATNTSIKGEYVFLDTVKKSSYTKVIGKTVVVNAADLAVTYT